MTFDAGGDFFPDRQGGAATAEDAVDPEADAVELFGVLKRMSTRRR